MEKIGAVIVAVGPNTDNKIYRLFELTADDLQAFVRGEHGPDDVDVWWSAGYVPGDTYEQQFEAAIRELTFALERYREELAIDEKCAHWTTPPSRLIPIGHELYTADGPNPICAARKLMLEGFVDGHLVYDVKSPTKWSVRVDGSLLHVNADDTVDLQQPNGEWKSLCK